MAVLKVLRDCDAYYIVCSQDGYAGNATVSRLGAAYGWGITVYSSHELGDRDLHVFVNEIIPIGDKRLYSPSN
ncbi:hypothetical protein [Okeania sp. SIO2B9]|uniref:hypothetical protein n=1 Tax=Okeania sp. SIO2B9 TaxID=2607782 RepID=UPI00142AB9F7|nr:hypothetical protein [Okeania sp. SIO2B9]NES93298.1 hypothetical protein [Okeania sp. SIO2B9]